MFSTLTIECWAPSVKETWVPSWLEPGTRATSQMQFCHNSISCWGKGWGDVIYGLLGEEQLGASSLGVVLPVS